MRLQTILNTMLLFCCLELPAAADSIGNISLSDKYAWSETAGWSNFTPTGGGVAVYNDHLEGFAWGENIGWIKLGSHSGGGAFSYSNSSNSDWGVNLNTGNLSGFAWSETAGWIRFNPAGGGVTIDTATGILDGYAWAENLGWLHFKGSSPVYTVRINAITLTVALSGSGSGSIHSTPTGISCAGSGTGCSNTFFQNWPVTLGATPDWKSLFTGYTGGSTLATFTMDNTKTVTATFALNYKVKLLPKNVISPATYYASIQDAYDNAATGDEIRAQVFFFQEIGGLTLGKISAKEITFKGGYNDATYGTNVGTTSVQGPLKIQSGVLKVEGVSIK